MRGELSRCEDLIWRGGLGFLGGEGGDNWEHEDERRCSVCSSWVGLVELGFENCLFYVLV